MAYQKSKHVEAAQKYLSQGKIPQAVAEYLVVLKHEPKDQIILMTVGDLYVRQGETFQALEYFERLAQIYLSDGFLSKAIAIYKKITKLAPEEMRPVERLADLYVQQGVMSEARPIYLQMAEMHQRASRPTQAVELLRKLLDAEPENPRVQSRLAELLLTTHQPAEAVNVLRVAAQQLLRRGDHAEAGRFADRALKIAPTDAVTIALRARVLVGAGKPEEALKMLESLPDVDAGGETSSLLVELYLEAGEAKRAGELAERIFAIEQKRHALVQQVAAWLLDRNEVDRALELLQLIHGSVLEGGEHEQYSELLARAAEALPGRTGPLEALVALYKHTSDSFRLPDALIHLAEAHEAAGNVEGAVQTYAEFLEREPENENVRRKREQLQAQSGQEPTAPAETPQVPQPVEQFESLAAPAPPPAPEENLDQETQLFIGQAITDVDLYSSYGLTQKAVELLEIVLERAPDHSPALERLLDVSLGLNDDARAVELALRLEQIYTKCGDRAAADRFADLRRRFERAASAPPADEAPEPVVAEVFSVPTVAAEPYAPPASLEFDIPVVDAQPEPEPVAINDLSDEADVSESAVHEVDLSEEWAALTSLPAETEASPVDASPVAFNDLLDVEQEADVAAEPLAAASEELEPLSAKEATDDLSDDVAAGQAPLAASDPIVQDLLAEYERQMNVAPAIPVAADSTGTVDSLINSITPELDAILPQAAAVPSAPPKAAESRGPLGDLFDEFRAEMSETDEKEDPETHYNLGIAYREMGLTEEAISEFQKVASAHQQGQQFRYAMQCYTLLALAFMEKGQPSIAVSWYERALQVSGLDPETVLALRYDLGVSQEMAGDLEAAHKSFTQVYGTNIDYRDVAERLAAMGRAR